MNTNTALRLVPSTLEVSAKRDYINEMSSMEPKRGILFSDYIFTTITRKAKRRGEAYKSVYNTLIFHLQEFSRQNEAMIFTNSVNEEFLDDFILYLEERNLRKSYIKSVITNVQSMVRLAATHGYAVDPSFDDVEVEDEEAFKVYLSMNEITRIYYFRGLSDKQERIKDLFIVGCLTAMRYSDYSTLTSDNFIGDNIVKITKKTSKKVIVPVHDYVKDIVKKYNGNINFGLTNQHFNRYIKAICEKVGLDDPITYHLTRGGKLVVETKPKWELISSHTARRSAATNMYLTGRFKIFEIMSITGHTTEKSFFRYIKITGEDVSKHLSGDSFFSK